MTPTTTKACTLAVWCASFVCLLSLLADPVTPATLQNRDTLIGLTTGYRSHAEMEVYMRDLERSFPSLCKLYSIGLSVKGSKLFVLQVTKKWLFIMPLFIAPSYEAFLSLGLLLSRPIPRLVPL